MDKVIAMPTIFESSDPELNFQTQEPTIITDSEASEGESQQTQEHESNNEYPRHQPMSLDLLFQEQDESDLPELKLPTREMEYHHWHIKLGHLSKTKMRQLIDNGTLPRNLSKLDPPLCSACVYGKATKTPWRTKGKPTNKTPREVKYPGECVAVDQLESSTPGFIGQLKGSILTKQRYRYATVFVDLFSDYTFLVFHTRLTSDETIRAKQLFEAHAATFGVKILNYHADNGRFQDLGFKEDCDYKGQGLSFCGVNAHFQNGKAEKKIRDLQDATCTSLLHAIQKWPQVITIHLWPYAMRYSNDVGNATPNKHESVSPIEKFSGTQTKLQLRHFYHFGCPTYVLDPNLQAGK
jgi:hypothetical protein